MLSSNRPGNRCLVLPTYNYQWQTFNGTTWVAISGQTSLNLTFSAAVTQATTYRRMVTETHSGSVIYTSVATVNVYPQLLGGTIAGSKVVNYNTSPAPFTSTTAASGGACSAGIGVLAYLWQQSTDNVTFTDMSAYTVTTLTRGPLTQTMYYRRKVNCDAEVAYSNTLTVTVNPAVYAGTIALTALNIASGTSPGALVADAASSGSCGTSFLYQWQSSPDNITYTNISGTVSQYYTPGTLSATTYYRRQVTCAPISSTVIFAKF